MLGYDDRAFRSYHRRFVKETGDSAEAEDLVQEMKLKLFLWERGDAPIRDLPRARNRVFQRVLADWVRRKYRQPPVRMTGDGMPESPDVARNPEEAYALQEKRARVQGHVRRSVAGRKQRILVENWERSTEELQNLMETTPEGVRAARAKVIRSLRRRVRAQR